MRAAAGLAVASRETWLAVGAAPAELALRGVTAVLAASFAAGFAERTSAYLLAPSLIALGFLAEHGRASEQHWIALAVVAHWATPAAPYGSLDARGRVDPRGEWRMPAWIGVAAAFALAGVVVTLALSPSRPWLALATLAALASRPAWIRARRASGVERVFYDGTCGACHAGVRFVLAEDRRGTSLRFAPLDGATAEREFGASRASLPDSFVVRTDSGELLVRSAAAIHVLERLGGTWRALAALLRLVPRPVRDAGYDAFARIRKSLFRSPPAACPLLPADLAERLDP